MFLRENGKNTCSSLLAFNSFVAFPCFLSSFLGMFLQLLMNTTVMVPTIPDFAPTVTKGWDGPVEMTSYKAAAAAAAAAMPGIPEHAETRSE
jgi:hypothetical protein